MGINGLNSFLKETIPEINVKINLSHLKSKRMAIDTSIYLYKYKYNNTFIESFFKQVYRIKKNGINPIYIFDGKPPIEKYNTIKSRKNKKIKVITNIKLLEEQTKCHNLLDKIRLNEKIDILMKKNIVINNDDIILLKYFFDLTNIPYIQSDTEADFVCGSLYKNNRIDMVLSEDNDLLVLGAKKLVKNFNIYSNKVILYDLDIILKKLDITNEQWIHFCILMGCDYCLKIKNMNSNNCMNLIKKYTINNIVINKLKLNNNYINDFNNAKKIFIDNTILDTPYIKNLNKNKFNKNKLLLFLDKHTTMSSKEINFILNAIDI